MTSLPLLRPLTITEILDRAIRLYRSHFVLLVSIPLVAFVPMAALRVASQFIWHTTQLIDLFQNGFVQILASGALVVAISHSYLTQPPTVGKAYREAWQHFGAAWGASMLIGLAIGIPVMLVSCGAISLMQSQGIWLVILLALPFAMFLGTRWNLLLPSVLLEHLGAQAGLGRSWSLTEGSFWKVFGTSFLANILILVLAALPQLAVTYGLRILVSDTNIGALVEIILAQVSIIVTTPVSMGVSVVLYYDLRVRKEAFDLEWQVHQAAATESSMPE